MPGRVTAYGIDATNTPRPLLVDAQGRVLIGASGALLGTVAIDQTTQGVTNRVAVGNQPTVTVATGAAAINLSTALIGAFRCRYMTCHFNIAPTTSQDFTVTLDSARGAAYDTVLARADPSQGALVDVLVEFEGDGLPCESGDQIVVAFPNTDARTYGVRIVTEGV